MVLLVIVVLFLGFGRLLYLKGVEECREKLEYQAAVLVHMHEQQKLRQQKLLQLDKNTRITVIDSTGKPILDNQADIEVMENHNHREEIILAKDKGSCFLQRPSDTIGTELFYYAVFLKDGSILRLSCTKDMVWKDSWKYLWFLVPLLLVVLGIEYLLLKEKEKGEKLRREFSANVSHELKTPLQSVLGYSELLQNNLVREEDRTVFAGKIHAEAENLLQMIDDIIKISKLDEEDMAMLERFSLQEICRKVVERLKPKAEQNNISLQLTGELDKQYYLTGIPSLMEEIVYNLVDNGIKYNNPYGFVRLDLSLEKGRYCLKVQDNGIGIAQEEQEKIFERFYRVDPSRQKKISGTGLGLSVVKHGLQLHRGELKLTSCLGEGSEFKLLFKPPK